MATIKESLIRIISIWFFPIAFFQTVGNCIDVDRVCQLIDSLSDDKSLQPTIEKELTFTNYIYKMIDFIVDEFKTVPDRSYYIVDRYFFHSPWCIFNKIRVKKTQYYHNGVPLNKYQGYNDYRLLARNSKISNNSAVGTFPIEKPKTSYPTTIITEKPPPPPIPPKTKLSIKLPPNKKVVVKYNSLSIFPSISPDDVDYIKQVSKEIKKVFPQEGYDDGSLAPIILRLAWHCCATYDKTTQSGGSNGATMRFVPEITDEGNTGLDVARGALEPIKQKFPKISYSDLWTLAGKLAIEEMGGPKITWKGGRVDCRDNKFVPRSGKLPFADKDARHIRTTFERMGFNDRETVALLGAHALGRCHKRFSGWEGKWTSNPIQFSNEFFQVLITGEWKLDAVPETGRKQYYNQDKSLIMLNTDLELIRDENFLLWVKAYAKDEEIFFQDFANAFSKLLELGIFRDENDRVMPKSNY